MTISEIAQSNGAAGARSRFSALGAYIRAGGRRTRSLVRRLVRGDPSIHRKRRMRKLYKQARPLDSGNAKVLFWVPGGMPLMLHVEGAIAAALRLRGVDVHAVICDGAFRACILRDVGDGLPIADWGNTCAQCKAGTSAVLDEMGIPYSFMGSLIPESIRSDLWERSGTVAWKDLANFTYRGINVGNNARSAVIRYLRGKELDGQKPVVREYTYSALIAAEAASRTIDRFSPTRLYLSHGIYSDWGPALQMALSRGISVSGWMGSYLPSRFYFRHIDDERRIDFHNLSQSAWDSCKGSDLSAAENQRLEVYFSNRYQKHITFDMKQLKKYTGQLDRLREKYAIVSGKPIWGIMAHINWDCVSDFSPMAYSSFNEWMIETINEIIPLTDAQWVVKVHPAEAWDNPASGVKYLLEKHFGSLPTHIRIISADDEISPLEFFELVDGGVTVYGTGGLELAVAGKPVILAGEAHYGSKGFTYDGLTRDRYKEFLRTAASLPPLTEEQQQLARRYAYCFFIQRQIPLPIVYTPNSSWWGFQFNQREALLPGNDPFIDLICDRLLDGKDFIMDETLVLAAESWESTRDSLAVSANTKDRS